MLKSYTSGIEDIPVMERSTITIGRSKKCSHKLEEPLISNEHLKLFQEGENFFLVDLESTNGTFLNGARISPNVKHMLHENDRIVVGPLKFKFKLSTRSIPSGLTEQSNTSDNNQQQGRRPRSLKLNENARNPFVMCPTLRKNTRPLLESGSSDPISNEKLISKIEQLELQIDSLNKDNKNLKEKESLLQQRLELRNHLLTKKSQLAAKWNATAKIRLDKIKRMKNDLKQTRSKRDSYKKQRNKLIHSLKKANSQLKNLKKQLQLKESTLSVSKDIALDPYHKEEKHLLDQAKRLDDILNEDLICSVCHEVFIQPYSISCGHSFCKFCINEWAKKNPNNEDCPICRKQILSCHRSLALECLVERLVGGFDNETLELRTKIIKDREAVCTDYITIEQLGARAENNRDRFFNNYSEESSFNETFHLGDDYSDEYSDSDESEYGFAYPNRSNRTIELGSDDDEPIEEEDEEVEDEDLYSGMFDEEENGEYDEDGIGDPNLF